MLIVAAKELAERFIEGWVFEAVCRDIRGQVIVAVFR